MAKALAVLTAGAAVAVSAPAIAAREPISVHSGWGAFREDGTCFAIAMAEPSPYVRERQPFASVVASGGKTSFTLRLSRTISRDAIVTLDVGPRRFRLRGGADSAWAGDGRSNADGVASSPAIVAAMRRSDTMTVGARDRAGRLFRDAYRLKGAPTAIDSAIIACR